MSNGKRAVFHRDADDYVSEFDGAGQLCLFVAGLVLMVVSCRHPRNGRHHRVVHEARRWNGGSPFPIIVIYPLLFGWSVYRRRLKLAEHKRRLQVMSTRDGMTGVYNRRHWETVATQ